MLVGYTLWTWAMVRGGVARTVPYLFLVPVVTGVISATVLGEQFGPLKLGGAALVLIGTTLVRVLERGIPVPSPAPPPAVSEPAIAGGLGSVTPAKRRAAH